MIAARSRVISHARTPLYRSAYSLMLSSALSSGLGLVYWVLAARLYPTHVVGLNSAAISAMSLLSGVSLLSLSTGIVRYVPRAGQATARFVIVSYLIAGGGAALAAVIFVLGLPAWAPSLTSLGDTRTLLIMFVAGTVGWSIFRLQDDVFAAIRRAEWVPLENGLYAATKLLLIILFAGWVARLGIYASWTIPAVLGVIPVNALLFFRLIPRHAEDTGPTATRLVPQDVGRLLAGDYVGSLFSLLATTLLPIIIARLSGSTATAYFYLPWVLTVSVVTVAVNMATSLTVEGSSDESQLAQLGRRSLLHVLRMFTPLVVLIVAGAPVILAVFGRNYADAGTALLRVLAPSTLAGAVIALYLGMCQVRRRIGPIVAVQAGLFVLVLPASWVLLPHFGILSVGIVWTASQSLVALLLLAFPLRSVILTRQ